MRVFIKACKALTLHLGQTEVCMSMNGQAAAAILGDSGLFRVRVFGFGFQELVMENQMINGKDKGT